MAISIDEFKTAMETYGATREKYETSLRFDVPVPCFSVGETYFAHSGTYYISQVGGRVSNKIISKAMAEFGEKSPGGDNFWYGEIHTVKGILTLAAMIENKYSRELIDELTNTTYKKLLDCQRITKSAKNDLTKMEELHKRIFAFDGVVNPFGNDTLDLKDPIEYLDYAKVSIGLNDDKSSVNLFLLGETCELGYRYDREHWIYSADILVQKNGLNGAIFLSHYFDPSRKEPNSYEEKVHLTYWANREKNDHHPYDIDLTISLKTGLAWQTYKEELAEPVTDEQIDVMIEFLNFCMKKINSSIIAHMIKTT